MSMLSWGAAALAAAACLVSCKERTPAGDGALAAKDFWPEAPAPVKTTAPHDLAYIPTAVTGLLLGLDMATPPRVEPHFHVKAAVRLRLTQGDADRARRAWLREFDLDLGFGANGVKLKLAGGELSIEEASGEKANLKRGDSEQLQIAGVPVSVQQLLGSIGQLAFPRPGTVEFPSEASHPFIQLTGPADNFALLFPVLPAQPTAPGATWTASRTYVRNGTEGSVPLDFHYDYAGDSACPSGAPHCAQILFTAAARGLTTVTNGITATGDFRFVGKAFVDYDRGALDESRIRIDGVSKAGARSTTVGGTMSLRALPAAASKTVAPDTAPAGSASR